MSGTVLTARLALCRPLFEVGDPGEFDEEAEFGGALFGFGEVGSGFGEGRVRFRLRRGGGLRTEVTMLLKERCSRKYMRDRDACLGQLRPVDVLRRNCSLAAPHCGGLMFDQYFASLAISARRALR